MRKFLFVFFLFAFLAATPTSELSVAESIVVSFYNNLKILSRGDTDDASAEATAACYDLVVNSSELLSFPNEFKKFGIEGSREEENLICGSFIPMFKSLARKRHLQFNYQLTRTIPFYEAEWKKSDKEASFVYCIVEKKYGPTVYNGVIRDTVLVDSNKKIYGIRNFAGGKALTEYHNQVPIITPTISPDPDDSEVDIESLHFAATSFYKQKKYADAFNTYQTILRYDPQNANAYYRLAIMSYRRQGCINYSRKETDKMAMTYINKAYDNGDSQLKSKINNILYYW